MRPKSARKDSAIRMKGSHHADFTASRPFRSRSSFLKLLLSVFIFTHCRHLLCLRDQKVGLLENAFSYVRIWVRIGSRKNWTGVAVNRGCDVDQPRNLAKSVTVE